MSRPVLFLHVGLMKTGTTYLQGVLDRNREALAAHGVSFVGETWSRQVRAAQNLLDLDQHDPQIASLSAGAWDALLADVRARQDAVHVVSMEFLSFARRHHAERLTRDLAGIETHVVVTVRDAAATIPAQWQTSVTSGSTHSWTQFRAGVRHAVRPWWPAMAMRSTAVREFRRTQDVGRVLDVWRSVVPADRLHVVTVPLDRRDPELLWRRFSEVIGVDPAVATEAPTDSNPSLGHPSAELVRRLNVALDDLRPWDYNRTVKAPLAASILAARRREERRPRLDDATGRVARQWNGRMRTAIERSGARVVGTLEDLPLVAPAPVEHGSAEPEPAEVLAAGAAAWHGLVDLVERRRRRVARIMGADRPEAFAPPTPGWLDGGSSAGDLENAVTDLTALARTAVQLRREMLELRERNDFDTAGDT